MTGSTAPPAVEVAAQGPLEDERLDPRPNALGTQWASADFGQHAVESHADSMGDSIGGSARATFRDDVTIVPDDPTLIGRSGRVFFEVTPMVMLDHAATGTTGFESLSGSAGWMVAAANARSPNLFLGTLSIANAISPALPPVETYSGDPLGATLLFEQFFVFGSPTEFAVSMTASANSSIQNPPAGPAGLLSRAEADLLWDGIVEVRDDLGSVVTGFSVISTSGVDWREPVPEPALPLSLALLGLAVALRSRKRDGRAAHRAI
ncbi:MAG: hypothetical protein AAGC67_08530 [Myxococcota bacterium]